MSHPKPKITLSYDSVSPWSFFALVILQRYKDVWNCDLELCPVYLGGVMIAAGNKPPMTVPNKGRWMLQDMPRTAEWVGIPFKPQPRFPVQTLNVIRLLRIIKEQKPERLAPASVAFYEAFFCHQQAIDDVKIHGDILKDVFDESTFRQLVQESQTPENKDRVKKEAVDLVEDEGAFGMPWIKVVTTSGQTHTFFGSDRFELIAHTIGKPWYGPHPEAHRDQAHL